MTGFECLPAEAGRSVHWHPSAGLPLCSWGRGADSAARLGRDLQSRMMAVADSSNLLADKICGISSARYSSSNLHIILGAMSGL